MKENRKHLFAEKFESDFTHPLAVQNSEYSAIVSKMDEEKFAPLNMSSLLRGKKALCAIYLKVSPDSFMPFLEKGDNINSKDVLDLLQKGVQQFYVEKSQIEKSDRPLLSICSLIPESS